MDDAQLKININGSLWCAMVPSKTKAANVLARILDAFVGDIKYMSNEAVADLLDGAVEMVSKVFGRGKLRSYTVRMESAHNQFYEFILRGDGMGRLSGFGLCEFEKTETGSRRIIKRFPGYNPEISTVKVID